MSMNYFHRVKESIYQLEVEINSLKNNSSELIRDNLSGLYKRLEYLKREMEKLNEQ